MSILWLFYDQYYQRVPLSRDGQQSFTVGLDVRQTLTVGHFPFTNGPITIEVKEETFSVLQNGNVIGMANEHNSFELIDQNETLTIFLTPTEERRETYYVGYQSEITYSSYAHGAHIFHSNQSASSQTNESFTLFKMSHGWVVEPRMPNLYLNGKRISTTTTVEIGDLLFCSFMTFRFREEDVLEIHSIEEYENKATFNEAAEISDEQEVSSVSTHTEDGVRASKREGLTIFSYSRVGGLNRGLWLIIMPPLIMLIVMGIVALIQPRGIFIIISLVMFMTTLVTSTVQFFKDKGIQKKRKERRRRIYRQYLETKRLELQELSEQQKKVLDFHFPSFERMKYLTQQISDRLWERL